jgi:hypothetical protein
MTDFAQRAASKAMDEGFRNCAYTNYFGRMKPCECDAGATDGCRARRDAIAAAIDAAYEAGRSNSPQERQADQ